MSSTQECWTPIITGPLLPALWWCNSRSKAVADFSFGEGGCSPTLSCFVDIPGQAHGTELDTRKGVEQGAAAPEFKVMVHVRDSVRSLALTLCKLSSPNAFATDTALASSVYAARDHLCNRNSNRRVSSNDGLSL